MRTKIISFFIACLLICGCTVASTVLHPKGIETVTYEQLQTLRNENNTFLLYIGRDDCGDCIAFEPILKSYLKEKNIGVYYLNIKAFRDASRKEDATEEEKAFFKNLYKELDFDWTPTIQLIRNHKIVDRYQYLNENYYAISDEKDSNKSKQDYIDEFKTFIDQYIEKYIEA